MPDPVVMELGDAAFLNLTESEIRKTVWFKHFLATYDQSYAEDKPGTQLVHKPSDRHHEHDQQWILDDGEAKDDGPMVLGAFQGCLFEDGFEVPNRYHGLPDTFSSLLASAALLTRRGESKSAGSE